MADNNSAIYGAAVWCVTTDFLRSISPVTGCQKLGKVMDEMMRESSYVRVVRFVLASSHGLQTTCIRLYSLEAVRMCV